MLQQLSCFLEHLSHFSQCEKHPSDTPVPLFGQCQNFSETEAAQSGRMYFWKDSASVSLILFICSDDFTHTVLIPSPLLTLFCVE